MMPDREPKKINRRAFLGKLVRGTIATIVLTACGDLTPFSPSPNTEIPPTPSGLSTEGPTALPTAIPTAENTPVPPTPVVTPERPDASGGLYTPDQMVAIEGGKFSDQEQTLAAWTKYVWTQGGNRAFAPETTRLNFVYYFDPQDPNSAGVCLSSLDYPGVCMTVPLDASGNPLPTPTSKITSPDIPEGMGPTMLSLQMDEATARQIDPINYPQLKDSVLGWSNGWVRMINGKVIARIGETGTWKTEIDYNQAFFDPQSEADFPKVIESPSPIDDPAGFAVWQEGYLAVVNEKLKTWTGPSINIVGSGIKYEQAKIVLSINEVSVIASKKFIWQGQEILTKTYVFNDGQGNLVPLSFTYTTPNSPLFDTDLGYISSNGFEVGVIFEWSGTYARSGITDPFAASFLPGEKNYTGYDALSRFMIGKSTAADRKTVSQARFMLTRP